jgi:hypothetical protein
MPDTRFEGLRLMLQKGGVAPVYIARTLLELEEHYTDLEQDALAAGLSHEEAARAARAAIGDERSIAEAILARPELLDWTVRHPRAASCLRSATTIGLIPGMPVMFCIAHRPELTRWATSIIAAATLIATVLAWIDWMIASAG